MNNKDNAPKDWEKLKQSMERNSHQVKIVSDYNKWGQDFIDNLDKEVKDAEQYKGMQWTSARKDIAEKMGVQEDVFNEAMENQNILKEYVTETQKVIIDIRGNAIGITESWKKWKEDFDKLDEEVKKNKIWSIAVYMLGGNYENTLKGQDKAKFKLNFNKVIEDKSVLGDLSFVQTLASEIASFKQKVIAMDVSHKPIKNIYDFFN